MTECKPPHAESLLIIWPGGWARTIYRLGRAVSQTVGQSSVAEYILYYKMYERVTNLCNISNLTNIISMNSCEKVI